MTTEIVVGGYTPQEKELMMNTIAKGCKPEQFGLMIELAKKYQLDPFARQIWATPAGIFVGRDGFLKIAHATGKFDGMETSFERDADGKLQAATCMVWHKDMSHPVKFTARLEEFVKPNSDAWKRMPHVMLQKCAESNALRRAFCISGLYDEVEVASCPAPELPQGYIDADVTPAAPAKPAASVCRICGAPLMDAAQRDRCRVGFARRGWAPARIENVVSTMCAACAADEWRREHPTAQTLAERQATISPAEPEEDRND